MATNGSEQADGASTKLVAGEVLFCGSTNWRTMGRSESRQKAKAPAKGRGKKAAAAPEPEEDDGEYPTLCEPHRISSLMSLDIVLVAAGGSSCHCLAVDSAGRLLSWGRNESGQLGLGDTSDRHRPTPLFCADFSSLSVSSVACGRHHSLAVLSDGSSWAWGANKQGQLGTGSIKTELHPSPVRCALPGPASAVFAGAEFSVWLAPPQGDPIPLPAAAAANAAAPAGAALCPANILSAGLPQYGQLGHGTDHEYNAKESSVRLVYEPQPKPKAIASLAGRHITKVACGTNHTLAVDSHGFLYTWGFGGYGRLGHREQKDEFRPRRVDVFMRQNVLPPSAVVAAGAAFSACTAGGGQLYMWGKVKSTGDNWMYPKPNMDMSGWHIRSLSCGPATTAAAAEASTISWGLALHQELGYGPLGPKTSANPKKIDSLEGLHSLQVAMGVGFLVALVSRDGAPSASEEQRKASRAILEKLPVFQVPEDAAPPAKRGRGRPPRSSAAEEEEEEDDEGETRGKKKGKGVDGAGSGRGRRGGRAAASGRGGAKPTGRGRGKA